MKTNAYAKINLMLDVTGKRPDGYHNIKTIMQTVSLCDEIEAETADGGIFLSGSDPSLPYDEKNLAYRAAEAFFKESKIKGGAKIYINKSIPVCAGLAGGSSDAAAVICALNRLYGNPLSKESLLKVGTSIGADVPFCIMKGTVLAEGIGEILTPLPSFEEHFILIVKPDIAISTPWAYKSLELDTMRHPDVDGAVKCLKDGDTKRLLTMLANVFEDSVFKHYPEIQSIKEKMLEHGAEASLMSGSGSAVFGIFKNEVFARNSYNDFKNKYKESFLTKNFNV